VTNIELKATYNDLDAAHGIAQRLGAIFQWQDEQVDTYYDVPKGRLKLRQCGKGDTELIAYNRRNVREAKRSDYLLYKVTDVANLVAVVDTVLSKKITVRKQRALYMWQNVRIHLDKVDYLGTFIEFEAMISDESEIGTLHDKIDKLTKTFNINPVDLVDIGYAELLLNKKEE